MPIPASRGVQTVSIPRDVEQIPVREVLSPWGKLGEQGLRTDTSCPPGEARAEQEAEHSCPGFQTSLVLLHQSSWEI